MGRPYRVARGNIVYHVLNRATARAKIFRAQQDYRAFEKVLIEGCRRFQTRILAYCVMPNHWHMVLWPNRDGELSKFVGWVSLTHTQRWHAHRATAGQGHVYQGRFKSFPVETDRYLFNVCRYVEGNALRAGLVERAEAWRWGSLHRRLSPPVADELILADWPIPIPTDWVERVNDLQTANEVEALRECVNRGRPYGRDRWVDRLVKQYGLDSTLRRPGRPRKDRQNGS
jgi:putative transposase